MMAAKGRKRLKKSIEEDVDKIYLCNLNFVPPKDQNLETIFEEPRESKDGKTILTSKIKYKRYLNFDPTSNKIQKRKRKAKKCVKKLKTAYRVTRSSSEASEHDVSLYFDILSESINGSDEAIPLTTSHQIKTQYDTPITSAQSENSSLTSEASLMHDTLHRPRTSERLKTNLNISRCNVTDSMCNSQGNTLNDVTQNSCFLS